MFGFLTQLPPSTVAKEGPIQAPRLMYAVVIGLCLVGTFAMAAVYGASEEPLVLWLVGMFFAVGLYNVAGAVRPLRLVCTPEGVLYRPVIGRPREVRWVDIVSLDYIFVGKYGSAIVVWRDRNGRRRPLGWWPESRAVVATLENWRETAE